MRCDECGGQMTVEENAVRRYDIGGLPHVTLHGVRVRRCGECGRESFGIRRVAQLHTVLAHMFVTQQRMLAASEIRFLRTHIGLSAADFARRMGVARETVSRWETGAKPIGAIADRLLRLLVVTHEPTESYAVDDLLDELTDETAPERPNAMAVSLQGRGWGQYERLEMVKG